MKQTRFWPIFVGASLILAACAPAGPGRPESGDARSAGGPTGSKTLTVALETEPDSLGYRLGVTSNTAGGNLQLGVHQTLARGDERGQFHPMLAVELPSQARGTWTLRPDGTMQTIYRIHQNVTWHDGTPLTAKDFVFGWTVSSDATIPQSQHNVAQQIARIDTPDDFTLVIEWAKTYPFANAIVDEDLGPLPVHLIQPIYGTDKERFAQLAYWSTEFVGVGPYRLAEWERGSHLVFKAYDAFYGGRPKIDTIIVRFMSNPPTVVANLLAGTIDGVIPRAIDFSDVMFVSGEWQRAGGTPVAVVQTTHWRMMGAQFRAPAFPEILDVRLRRALLHAIDRKALADTLLDGQSPVSETFMPPTDARWEWVKDVVAKYEHDPRRTQQLLSEVGWRRGADGAFVNAAGARVPIALWTTQGAQNEQEQSIIADGWRSLGLAVEQRVLGRVESDDRALRASFPAFETNALPISFTQWMSVLYGPNCPTEANRWAGRNRGCYQNPELDRLVDGLNGAIDPADQRRLFRDLVKLETEDLSVLPLYFNVEATLFRDGVTGVRGNTMPKTSVMWNILEWDLR